MAELQISKLDAARRQIETAIRLYFCERDPVAIHTLTAAGYELLRDLNKHRGGSPMWFKEAVPDQWVKPQFRREVIDSINKAENFFKHADRDPENTLRFNPEQSDVLLLDCCEKYRELTGERLPMLAIYQIWAWTTWAQPFVEDERVQRAAANGVVPQGPNPNRQAFFEKWLPLAHEAGLTR